MIRLRLKQIQRDYLWGGGALEWKPHLARWVTVCLDKIGGLRMRERPFGIKRSRKYGEERGGWCSREVRDGYSVGLSKAIRKEWHIVDSRLAFVVDNGQRMKFGRISGVGLYLHVILFPSYLLSLYPRTLG
ncbi:hypothetical protein CK203_024886 [Vitis vinifera]|uniref:Uncharacterized protein n=1 Tax=Vitis vinifera TaxID=29760 RepID=A0A438ITN2_VITVI|nr:hypothetical protein CK203_024886 [Vitis vinifera]